MWRRWSTIIAIAAGVIALLWWVETAYTPFHDNKEYYYSNSAGHKQSPGDDLLRIVFWLVVDAIERHRDLWLVLETLVIALFTGTLWWSTRRLWQTSREHAAHMEASLHIARESAKAAQASAEAANRSAEALPALERAYLDLEVNPLTANIINTHINSPIITYRFANHGKTPAILKHFSFVFRISRNIPGMVNAETIPYDNFLIGAGSPYPEPSIVHVGGASNATVTSTHGSRIEMRPTPTEDDLTAIRCGEAYIWFCGRLVYRDVFSRDDRVTAFCYRYSGIEGQPIKFARDGGDDHNYRT